MDLLHLLKSSRIFSTLDDATLKSILDNFKKIHLNKNEILFRQGDMSNSLYLVVSGKIATFLKSTKAHKKLLREILPGDLFGELAALSHEPRAATAVAVRKTILLELSSEHFIALCEKFPAVSLAVMNSSLTLSRILIRTMTEKPSRQHIVIIPATTETNLQTLHDSLEKEIKRHPNITLLSDINDNDKSLSNETWQTQISELNQKNKTIIYLINSFHSTLSNICFNLGIIDMIYIAAIAADAPELSQAARAKIRTHQYKIKPELILLHTETNTTPKNTTKWLKLSRFNLHHHIRIHEEKDWQRLLRFMSGRAIGVVFGGGGLRCWAQFGALLAMRKLNIPIDAIGGTSAGSIVAGYFAMNESLEHSTDLRELSAIASRTVAIKNVSWPSVSIFNGKDYTNKLKEIFGSTRIENLWTPFFCISTNLSSNKQIISRRGFLWKSIRSSTSVPMVYPPVIIKGNMRIDGGLLNNLPVDVMKNLLPPASKIIAVELTHRNEDTEHYNFPLILPFWETAMTKAGLIHKHYKFPHFVDTFLKSFLAGASAKQEENAAIADALISPDLSGFHLLNVSRKDENALIKIGYKATLQQLKKLKK